MRSTGEVGNLSRINAAIRIWIAKGSAAMSVAEPSFSIGIEEEYLLVNRADGQLAKDPPGEFMEECATRLGDQVSAEFLRAQVEVGTRPAASVREAAADLFRLRREIASAAESCGLAPVAASTHPFADHEQLLVTDHVRYQTLVEDLQAVARRLVISGMHVHVGIEDDDLRVDLMSQMTYFLPHLLALSTSSPFWQGRDSGLMSYRIAVWDELPRTGLPERCESWSEYCRVVTALQSAGVIEDASKVWWDLRPSWRYPTLEMRICDLPTRVVDTVAVAALYLCILRMLYRLRRSNQRWRVYPLTLVKENRWRAQRYGTDDTLIDFGILRQVPYADLQEELLQLVAEDIEALDCAEEVAVVRDILRRGTSAHRQRKVYREALARGASQAEAMSEVVRMLVEATVQDL